jgi:subtilisin family serine protease
MVVMPLNSKTALAAILLFAMQSIAPATWAAPDEVPGAQRVKDKIKDKARLPVIVQLKALEGERRSPDDKLEKARGQLRSELAKVGVAKVKGVGKGPFVALEVDGQQLQFLLESGLITSIEENAQFEPHLIESAPLVSAPQALSNGAGGSDQVVVIIDSGVEKSHPFLTGRVVAEACSASDCNYDPYAYNGPGTGEPCAASGSSHGTHVAGIAAGSDSSRKGVSPQASVISIRAWCSGSFSMQVVTEALDYVQNDLATRFKIASVNMSLGTSSYRSASDCDASQTSLAFYINGMRELGIMSTVSAGNSYDKTAISAPACISNAISVGATTDYGTEAVTGFSNSAPILDVLAPGDTITSSVISGSFGSMSGTSMAAPHVAGAIAGLRSKVPAATPSQIEQALESTGKAITDPGNNLTKPRINVYEALVALGGTPTTGWKNWVSRGGNLASYPECELTGSGIACWARTASGTLTWNQSTDGNTWSGWTDLAGSVAAMPDCLVRGSRIDCFVTTSLKQLAQITYNGTSWSAWANRGGTVVDRPSCVPASSGLALDCFARGANNALWRLPFDGTAWKPWQSAGGSMTTRPECVRRGPGIDCFIVNSSKNLQTRRLTGSTWNTWKQIGTGFGLPPHCLVSSNTMDCFAQSSTRQLLKGYFNGSTWSAWTNQGGDVYAQPYCNRLSTGFDCYWTTTTFKLIRRERRGTTWQPQVDLGGSVQQRPICLARNDGARIDCMVRGQDNTLQQRSYY